MSGEGEAEQGFFVGLRGELGLQEATADVSPSAAVVSFADRTAPSN
jgi:hypothetical protein